MDIEITGLTIEETIARRRNLWIGKKQQDDLLTWTFGNTTYPTYIDGTKSEDKGNVRVGNGKSNAFKDENFHRENYKFPGVDLGEAIKKGVKP